MALTYTSVSFNPGISEKQASKAGGDTIARHMADTINSMAGKGWKFVSYETVDVGVSPGCLGALLGGKTSIVSYGVLIFSNEV